MSSRELQVELFGRQGSMNYSESWLGYSILGLRALMAWIFIQGGLAKILDPEWSSTGFLENSVVEANPFFEMFQFFLQHPEVVDPMIMYGQLLIGLALLLGLAFRFAAAMGGLQMAFFWLASFEGGFIAGLPVEHGFLVTETLVYVVLLFGLGAWGAGRLYGLDTKIEEQELVEENPWLKYFLG